MKHMKLFFLEKIRIFKRHMYLSVHASKIRYLSMSHILAQRRCCRDYATYVHTYICLLQLRELVGQKLFPSAFDLTFSFIYQ